MFTLKAIKENNGMTISKAGAPVNYKGGYQVSLHDMEVIKASDLRKKHLVNLLKSLDKGLCLGIWIDGGKVYIDQSKRIATKAKAMQIGKEYNQISVWNWRKGEAVAVA